MKIIDFNDEEERDAYSHLVEYQVKPADLPGEYENFRPRETFPTGNLLCGDLIINEESTKQLEVHPFPEWVVQLTRLDPIAAGKTQVDGYCIALNLTGKQVKKFTRKDWSERKKMMKEKIKASDLQADEIIAFPMNPGICLKVQENVPHYFVSAQKDDKQVYPYCQVYEPSINWDELKPFGRFEPTAYFPLKEEIQV